MALISCPECGKQMSDKASACPHCGAPAAVSAAAEKKCGECGAVLPEGAAACPVCGCPVGERQAQSYQPQQTVQYGQPVQPNASLRRLQPGSAKTIIDQKIRSGNAAANTVGFIALIISTILYVIAFPRYMKVIEVLENSKLLNVGAIFSERVDGLLNDANILKIALIATLILTGLVFIYKMFKMSRSEATDAEGLALLAMAIVGFALPGVMLLKTLQDLFEDITMDFIKDALDLLTKDNFGTYMWVAPLVIVGLGGISEIVNHAARCKETDFCPKCGEKIQKFDVKRFCPGCNESTLLYGYTPIPRDVLAAYPYSGEPLSGESPKRKAPAAAIVTVDILFFIVGFFVFIGIAASGEGSAALIAALATIAVIAVYTVIMSKNGPRDKVVITPMGIELRSVNQGLKKNTTAADITDVLSNENGHLAICLRSGECFIFKDLSDSARIAAALTSMSAKR